TDRYYQTVEADLDRDTKTAEKENEKAVLLMAKVNPYHPVKLEKAEAALNQALVADVTYGPAHNNLGKLYFLQNKFYHAAWEFEYALRLMPERVEPINNLGMVYEAVGKFGQAIEAYQSALAIDPRDPNLIGNLVRTRMRSGESVADVQHLLQALILFEERPDWAGWAREQMALANLPASTQRIESIPAPGPAPYQPGEPIELPPPDGRLVPEYVHPKIRPVAMPNPNHNVPTYVPPAVPNAPASFYVPNPMPATSIPNPLGL
ncbi:MAG: tetratricopeptide repeat protein, partial [Planctomycetales bacterium]